MHQSGISIVSVTDTEILAMFQCAKTRLVVLSPGFSVPVAAGLRQKWLELGASAVRIVIDPDPEVCRLGFGDASALTVLYKTAEELGATLHQQQGLRVGVLITDETTIVYTPTPLLIEAGGRRGERLCGVRLDVPVFEAFCDQTPFDFTKLDLNPCPVTGDDVKDTVGNLEQNPPLKFDIAQRLRAFNAQL